MNLSPNHFHREPAKPGIPHSALIRQWQLLEQLAAEDGITVLEASEAFDVTTRTIHRDLTLLEQVGFDLEETLEGTYCRKRWRLRRACERLETRPQRYQEIGRLLDQAREHAKALGDGLLEKDLEALRQRVGRE